jgi:hypothetical protein
MLPVILAHYGTPTGCEHYALFLRAGIQDARLPNSKALFALVVEYGRYAHPGGGLDFSIGVDEFVS